MKVPSSSKPSKILTETWSRTLQLKLFFSISYVLTYNSLEHTQLCFLLLLGKPGALNFFLVRYLTRLLELGYQRRLFQFETKDI